MLRFDWSAVEGQVITAVFGEHDVGHSWWAIAICIGCSAVVLRVNEDTDEIIVTHEPRPQPGADWKPVTGFEDWIGKHLSWCWVSRNSQGYLDMFTVALSDIGPSFAFVAAASSLTCRRLMEFRITK